MRTLEGAAMTVGKSLSIASFTAMCAAGFASTARAEGIDCGKAHTPVEKAICGNADLRALDQRVATAYARLLKELDPGSAKALRSDQRWFLSTRDNATAVTKGVVDKADLADALKYRAKFLEAIVPHPGPGLVGHWQNVAGVITLATAPDKRITFEGNAADPQSGRWVCDAAGDGPQASDTAKIAIKTDDGPWTITAARQGATLGIDETPPSKDAGGPPYCGFNGSFSGVYFLTNN